jgi:hypothetical protein
LQFYPQDVQKVIFCAEIDYERPNNKIIDEDDDESEEWLNIDRYEKMYLTYICIQNKQG